MTIEWRWLIIVLMVMAWNATLSLRLSALEHGCVRLLKIVYV